MSAPLRTLVQALEDAAASSRTGYRFVAESGEAEPYFTYAGVERASARFGGAFQALGLRKSDPLGLAKQVARSQLSYVADELRGKLGNKERP